MKNTYCVYIHTNKINGKKYVGQTVYGDHPQRRWSNGSGYQTQKYFWSAIQKYGWNNFEHEVITSGLTKQEADDLEMLLIRKLNTTNADFGYNIALGGGGTLGRHPSPDQIEKQKQAMRKHYTDENFIQKMRDVAPKKIMWQFTQTGEFVTEYPSSKEAERQTGVNSAGICSCALRKIPSAGGYIWTYQNDADDILERVLKYQNTKLRNEPIVQLTLDGDFVQEWVSAANAGRVIGINYKNINLVCHNKRNQAGGFKWMFLSDYIQLEENKFYNTKLMEELDYEGTRIY